MAGRATYREDLPLVMNRRGYDEQAWFTFSYSPVRDGSGAVTGMFCAVSETTQRVLAERALRELNDTLERRVAQALAERSLLASIVEATGAFVQVTHVAGLGNLGALVADLQTHGMPADVTKAIRYVNAYDVWMPDDM